MSDTVCILFPAAATNPVYQGWIDRITQPVSIVRHYDTNWTPPDDAGIVITHNHYRWEELSILRRIVDEGKVPVLILADGILEYRNTFEHPDLADGAMFRPLMGHKLACIGRSQARWVEAWGNVGKCEITGIPRFDGVTRKPVQLSLAGGSSEAGATRPWRILIATASTPWFNDQQKSEVLAALNDLREYFSNTSLVGGRPVEIDWRMNEELHEILREGSWKRKRPGFAAALADTDAVITTPSTVQLEAALHGKPVAVIDYHNAPHFTPSAWTIPCKSAIATVVDGLLAPSPGRMFVQDAFLTDALEHHSPALPRMQQLISAMIAAGKECRKTGRPLELPPRILVDQQGGFTRVEERAHLRLLFPNNPAFQTDEMERLQLELAQARAALGEYPEKFFEQRSANLRLRNYINWLRTIIRNRADSLNEMNEALKRVRDRSGPQNDDRQTSRQ
jgi:hypothetical protein